MTRSFSESQGDPTVPGVDLTKRSPWVRKAAQARGLRPKRNPGDLHLTINGDGTQRVTIPDVKAFRARLQKDVTEAFVRCFVHKERLSALADWIRLLNKHEDPQSVTVVRDGWTVLWFAVGTLKEFGIELDKLKGHLRRARLFDDVPDWGILKDVSRTWVHDPKYNKLRDVCSFHTNSEVIAKGLQQLSELRGPATLGDLQADGRGFTRIGTNCQLLGIGWEITEDAFKPLYELASEHTVKAPLDLHKVFAHVLNAVGIKRSEP